MKRCEWAKTALLTAYHDTEWGVPLHDDRALFEFLILEGAQAGLSWEMILKKRDAYRIAFDRFDPHAIAEYKADKINELLQNQGIIRNRLKISAAVINAKAFLNVQKEAGSFDAYLWQFVGGQPRINRWKTFKEAPCQTAVSEVMSKDLVGRGFKFAGTKICYSLMQAVGMVNDHIVDCFRYDELNTAH
jgi:DNA-3-methyladenine glycosylase I